MSRSANVSALVALSIACSTPAEEALHVYAASSLTDALADVNASFEAAHGDVQVSASFAGSQILRLQIEHGAPADVFVSADEAHMRALAAAGHVHGARVFAHNELVVIVPRENPARVTRFADLSRATRVVIGDESAPLGRYTRQLLARAGEQMSARFASDVLAHVVSEESNARLVRAKVELGEADAAVVYRTDAAGSARVRVIEIPRELAVRADYYAGLVASSPRRALAERWIAHLESDAGRRALATHGFTLPE